jgi:hypothetical protein
MKTGSQTYEGIHNDKWGGMTMLGNIVKEAWIFGILPETETCEGWTLGRMQNLYEQVSDARAKYGFRFADLPPEIQERHERIHREAMVRARELGWDPDADLADEG